VSEAGAVASPAAAEQEIKRTRQQQAEEAIKQDAFVREAQSLLGAQIVESSIKPIQQ
jgi:DNA polymerase-3 subunit gamma/tau